MKNFAPILFILFITFFACEKNDKPNASSNIPENRAEPIISDSKAWVGFILSTKSGHSSTGCEGCVTHNGHAFHVDCQGAGSSCTQKATVYLYVDESNPDVYYAINDGEWELAAGDFFLMPERSLYIMSSNGEYLNIPEQMLYRDEETGKFILYDIFFTEWQVFENK
jgi:hypothetical protein